MLCCSVYGISSVPSCMAHAGHNKEVKCLQIYDLNCSILGGSSIVPVLEMNRGIVNTINVLLDQCLIHELFGCMYYVSQMIFAFIQLDNKGSLHPWNLGDNYQRCKPVPCIGGTVYLRDLSLLVGINNEKKSFPNLSRL